MQQINILHLGPGNVGKEFLSQFLKKREQIERKYGLNLKIIGIFNSKSNPSQIASLINKTKGYLIVIDTTASPDTYEVLAYTLKRGGFVVLSNKKPLADKFTQFKKLYKYEQRLFFETTVGAGLPIISTICELQETGDKIIEIQGCFSGTLGYLFSELEKESDFSKVVKKAKDLGFTEPDPRDDLSGTDVGRKALILARLMGQKINLKDFGIQSLYPDKLKNITVDDFLNSINTLDDGFRRMMEKARNQNCTLRYVASVSASKISVGLKQVPKDSDIGTLKGPDNIVVIKTNRYNKNPLIIKGPGAGKEVTAAGVFGDLLKIIKILKGSTL